MKAVQITGWCARFIREQVQPGDICIDATMGNGMIRFFSVLSAEKTDMFLLLIFRKRHLSIHVKGSWKQMHPRIIPFFWNRTPI